MKTSKRKTRSDKFPLTFHPTGQYCKKIKGKMYYFGSDKKRALEKYLDQATYLHGCQNNLQQKPTGDDMTLKQLCDMYLKYQYSKLQANDLTASHHNEQIGSLNRLMAFLGQTRKIKSISTLDLQNYKRRIQKSQVSVCRLNLHISIMKALFHWARKNDVIANIPNIDAISRGKIIHQERFTFNSEQISQVLSVADVKMQAMIWLGLNCGFGCTDCAELKWTDLDLINARVKLPRRKTGISRDLPLWPETVQSLETIPRTGKLVFYTSRGSPYIQTLLNTGGNGNGKYTTLNTITTKFSRLLKKSGLGVPKGTGFYTLRRTAATIAARSGDPFAVQRLLGHADLQMATRYVQDVSAQTDRVIEKSRMYVCKINR
ncbi:MAG: tyrosine-type recombinase/integrase [Sedimentisphaerales bacterium]|jgi:integrase